MAHVNKLFISLHIEGQKFDVGELVLSEQNIYFRYNSDFLQTGLNLSPIKLPFNKITERFTNFSEFLDQPQHVG